MEKTFQNKTGDCPASSVPRKITRQIYDWSKVDWKQPNKIIAIDLGCSFSTVSMARRRYLAPLSSDRWDFVDWSLPVSEIARAAGCSKSTVYAARRRCGFPGVLRFEWSSVDWDMRNADIARSLGCTPTAVVHARKRITGKSGPYGPGRPRKETAND